MTVEEQLAAALAQVENLRMTIVEKDCIIQDLQNKLLYDILRRQILSSEYVQIDESVIPVIDNEKHKARKDCEWCVRDAVTGDVMSTMTGAAEAITLPRKSWVDTGETYNATAMRHMTSLKRCPG